MKKYAYYGLFFIVMFYYSLYAMEEEFTFNCTQALIEGIYNVWIPKLNGSNIEEVSAEIDQFLKFFSPEQQELTKNEFIRSKAEKLGSEILQHKKKYGGTGLTLIINHKFYDGRKYKVISVDHFSYSYRKTYPAEKNSPWLQLKFKELLEEYSKKVLERQRLEKNGQYFQKEKIYIIEEEKNKSLISRILKNFIQIFPLS